jgi:pimeloyl-ACP methyl ester carboxylesterase
MLQWVDESGEQSVIGVGHSLGAIATLSAALRRPEMFRAVVLIDPVLLHQRLLFFWRLFQKLGLAHQVHPLISGAKRRRRVFATKAEMFARYRPKAMFARLTDPALQAYVDAMARPRADGQFDLAYPPDWEVAIYAYGPITLWNKLRELRPPLLIIRGEHSDTFHPPAMRQVHARLPEAKIITVPNTGHLVPLEQPEEVARLIREFLQGHS